MFVSYALSTLHTEAREDVYNVVSLNFLQPLNKAHIYHTD